MLIGSMCIVVMKGTHAACIVVSQSSALIGPGNRGTKLKSSTHEMREENREAAVDRIIENATDPFSEILRRLDDPAYVKQLIEAQAKLDNV